MSLLPFQTSPGVLDPVAAFINMVLIDCLYRNRKDIVEQYASISGSQLLDFVANPESYPPDYCVLKNGNDVLVVIAGTTNNAQWGAHAGSMWAPSIDPVINRTVLLSFQLGEGLIEVPISNLIGDRQNLTIRFAGHSYGGACGHIMAVHFNNAPVKPFKLEMMTVGEPKAFGGSVPNDDFFHARVTNSGDPVQYFPPSISMLYGVRSGIVKGTILALALRWAHHGQRYNAPPGEDVDWEYDDLTTITDIAITDLVFMVGSLPFADEHTMDKGYLPKVVRYPPPGFANGIYKPIYDAAVNFVESPEERTGNFGPPITVEQQNEGWQRGQANPLVTSANQSSLALVSSFTEVKPFNFSGVSGMVQFKGTINFGCDNQGFSESVYAVPGAPNSPQSYGAMLSAMQGALPLRMKLSYGRDNIQCANPVFPVDIRVEDESVLRDALVTSIQQNPFPGIATGTATASAPENQNMDVDLCAKISWQNGNSRQKAVQYIHGLPVFYFGGNAIGFSAVFTREANPNAGGTWLQNLFNYANYLSNQGLGFRYLNSPWDLANGMGGPNAQPVSVQYNPNYSMYEMQMPAGAVGMNPFDTYVLRKWKGFNFLNGRWPGQLVAATAPQTGTVIRILRKCRQVTNLQPGTVSLQRWGYFVPNPMSPPAANGVPGVVYYFVTEKKVGRITELQRGRARNRPT